MNSVTRSPCSDVGSFVICFYCNESFHSLSSLTKHFCSAEQNNSLDLDPLDDFSDITCIDLAQEDNVISSKCFSETPMQGTTESDTNIFGGNSFSNMEYEKASPCTKEQESNSIVVKVVTKLVNDESDNRLIEPNSDVVEVVTNLVNEISETNFEVIEVIKQGTEASKEKLLVLDTGQINTDAEPNADEEFNATSPDLVSKVLQCNEKQSLPSTPNNFCKSPFMEIQFQSLNSPLSILESVSPRHNETQIECSASDINNTSLTSKRKRNSNREKKTQNESETSEDNIIPLKPQTTNTVSALSPIIESITTIGNIKSLESQPYRICSTPSPKVESDSSNMFSRSSSVDMEFDSLGCDDNQADSDDSETCDTLLSETEEDLVKNDQVVSEKFLPDNTILNSFLENGLNKANYNSKTVLKSCYVKVQDIFMSVPKSKVSPQKLSNWEKKLHVCDMCNKFFCYKSDLKIHNLSHSTIKQFVCNLCNKSFLTQRNLFAHHFVHSIKRKNVCSVCKMKFTNRLMLLRHKLTHAKEKSFACKKCDKTFTAKSLLTNHHTTHSDAKPFVCEICSEEFSLKRHLKRHYYTHNEKNSCDLCFKTFKHSHNLEAHYNFHTNKRPHKCNICNKAFHLLLTLNHHYVMSHGVKRVSTPSVHVCSVCKKRFLNRSVMLRHMLTHSEEKPFACDKCGKSFKMKCALNEHYTTHSDARPFVCEICSQAFSLKRYLSRHYYTHKKKNSCDLCFKTFKRSNNLEDHYNFHTNKRPYKCEICNKAFHLMITLKHHYAMCHRGRRASTLPVHVCSVCEKKFLERSIMLKHMLTHSEKKPFACDKCDKSFKVKHSLNEHYTTHSDARPFICEICSQTFSLKRHLSRHYYTHNKKNSCDLCFKTFKRSDHLEAHYNFHTNERPHKCKICNKAFHLLLTLNHHYTMSHRDERAFTTLGSVKTPVDCKINKKPIIVTVETCRR